MSDFYSRAAKIFKGSADGISWPYGLHDPDWRLKRRAPKEYERQVADQPPRQRLIVEWAERYDFRRSPSGCCPLWLLRPTSRRCPDGACRNYGGLDYLWLDHTVAWLKNGRPAALTSAPYSHFQPDDYEFRYWLAQDERLRFAFGAGWYGHGTTQIVLWRMDRIDTVLPATPPASPDASDRTDGAPS